MRGFAEGAEGYARATLARVAAAVAGCLLICIFLAGPKPALAAPGQFGEEGAGAGQLSSEPLGIAVSRESGDVLIADRKNNRAARFAAEGAFALAWGEGVADGVSEVAQTCITPCFAGLEGSGSGEFSLPEGIAVDNDPLSPSFTDVYVADQRNHRVQKFSQDGTFILMFGGEVNQTADETTGSSEAERNLCTAASGDVCQAGTTGTGNGQFEQTAGSVAVDNEGTVYVGDVERVQKFNTSGEYVGQLTLAGAGDANALAVDASKDLYVKSNGQLGIHKYDEGGVELGEPRDELGEPSAIALGPSGELFVSDGPNLPVHHIFEYDASGAQTASFDAGNASSGHEDGFLGIAFSESLGVLYVLNTGTVRLVSVPPPGPLIVSQSAEAIEPTSATLAASVNPEGPEATSYHFEYGTTAAYGESTAVEELKGGAFEDQAVSAAIAELQPRTVYHFRVVLSRGGETFDGPDQTFTTQPPVLVDGEFATQVTATSANLGAELNPLGQATEYHFEFGLSSSYGSSAPIPDETAGSTHADVTVAVQIQGLTPGTVYHYRVVAHNALGSVQGEDRTFTTEREQPSVLPDGRQWEMVSPPNKEGVSLEALAKEGAVIQAADDGSAITYVAKAAIEAESPGNRSLENTQVLSKRAATGWQSKDISTPHEKVSIIRPGLLSEYKLFSEDLASGVVEPQGSTPLSAQTSEPTPYLRNNGDEGQFCLTVASCYRPLVTGCPAPGQPCPASVREAANVPPGTEFGGVEQPGDFFSGGVEFASADPQTSRIVLASPRNLTAGYDSGGEGGLFEWSAGTLRPVSVLPNGEDRGASLADRENLRGVVAAEADRVAFAIGSHIYLRDLALGQTVQLDEPQGGSGGGTEDAEFQGANRDGGKVFFTDDARLTSGATAKPNRPDLYECEVGVNAGKLSCTLHDLTVDANLGQAADVQGEVSAFGDDGSLIYFAANGVLAAGAQPGDCAEETEEATCNLYARNTVTGQTKLVALLSGRDAPVWNGNGNGSKLGNLTARSSPDGGYLAFMSERSLTGYDNRDASSGERDEEVFLYNWESGTVRCVSCAPSGARPHGIFDADKFPGLLVDRPRTWRNRWLAASIPGWTLFDLFQSLYQSRYLSNGGRMFFNSADALLPQDANGKEDVYEYEPDGVGDCVKPAGCQRLISSGTSSEESAFMDASADGSNAFFMTAANLSEADVDSDFDLYDAHICTSSSPCPASATAVPPPCTTTDSCRVAPAPQPQIFGPPPSATFSGAGNPTPTSVKPPSKAKRPTRARLLAKALKACAKKPKKKRAACRAVARRRYGPKNANQKHAVKGAKRSSRRLAKQTAKGRA